MRRFRYLLLGVLMLAFLGGMLATMANERRISELVSSQVQKSAWSMAQLELEFQRFCSALQLYRSGSLSPEDLLLAYDVAWNRMEIFLIGDDNRIIRGKFGAEEMVGEIFALLKRHESLISATPPRDSPILAELEERLDGYIPGIRELMVKNFTGEEASRAFDAIRDSQRWMAILLAGLLLMGLLMMFLLVRETRQHLFLSRHDPLTRLPNRSNFIDTLQAGCARTDLAGRCALCLIDLNHFKEINDSLGHQAGDALLMQVGRLLQQELTGRDLVARIGGDEFALVLRGELDETALIARARRLLGRLQLLLAGLADHRVHPNMGMSLYPQHARDPQDLFLFADLSLSAAKRGVADNFQLFNVQMLEEYRRRKRLAADLHLQLNLGEGGQPQLYLCYQPILPTGKPDRLGCEVLLRWLHPELGFVSPMEIVDVAESHGLGTALGDWIFGCLNRDLARLPASLMARLEVSVNLSSSLFHADLPTWVLSRLAEGPLSPAQLVLELTETIALKDFRLSQLILQELAGMQIRVALDDFGTGWSSLSYLRELRVHKLKIDKSFIQGIDSDSRQQVFVRSITELAHNLGVRVVAEGVETQAELALVERLGVNEIQGYYYARPLSLDAFAEFAERQLQTGPEARQQG